ncbi:unnamed protein product [Sphagnum jensenii]|uniref:FCP1 homology domain-containing protein n=1 Tax=Sphagnum jensenii TaxID=128206 RepID=A0ABP1B4B4_9BRYO
MHQVLESSRKPELSEAAASSRRQKGQFVNACFVTVLRKKVLDIGLDPGLRHPATPQAYVFDDAPEISIHSSKRHFGKICGFDAFLMKLLVCPPPARVCDSTTSTSSTSTDPPTDSCACRPLTTTKI